MGEEGEDTLKKSFTDTIRSGVAGGAEQRRRQWREKGEERKRRGKKKRMTVKTV
jgi:hypothetical protein